MRGDNHTLEKWPVSPSIGKTDSLVQGSKSKGIAVLGDPEISPDQEKRYLQYAPQQFIDLREETSTGDKRLYMNFVEFTEEGPNILGKSGKRYLFDKNNLSVSSDALIPGYIERQDDETYFSWDEMQEYIGKLGIEVPTDKMYMDILRIMPRFNGSTRGPHVAQLCSILGVSFKGLRTGGGQPMGNGTRSFLWTASCTREHEKAGIALKWFREKGKSRSSTR